MRAKVFTNAAGVTATFDGRRLRVALREDDSRYVLVERSGEGWAVLSSSGALLGDLKQLDEAAVRAAGLHPCIARIMRGVLQAVEQVEGEPPESPDRWEVGEVRPEDGQDAVPVGALAELGADGWQVAGVHYRADGAMLRVLVQRRVPS